MIKKSLIGTGLITTGLLLWWIVLTTQHEERPEWLTILFSISAAVFTGLLIYFLLQKLRR